MRRFLPAYLVSICSVACAVESFAPFKPYGGWRHVSADVQAPETTDDLTFLLLPSKVAKNAEFKAYDSVSRELVCCLVVQSDEVKQPELKARYRVNPAGIEDLIGDLDGETFSPHVYKAERRGELKHHEFANRTDAVGGLVVTSTARLTGRASVSLDRQTYRIERKEEELGDGDGSLARYRLIPLSSSSKILGIVLSFRTY